MTTASTMAESSRTIRTTLRVLIVEDETRLREMLVRAVTDMGFSAHGAASGEAATRILAKPGDIAIRTSTFGHEWYGFSR